MIETVLSAQLGVDPSDTFIFRVDPMGAVRSNQKSHFVSSRVKKYHMYMNSIRERAERMGLVLPESGIEFRFYFEMPKSWSKKKKLLMNGQPHRSKPDLDNLIKGFVDALYWKPKHLKKSGDKNDCAIWSYKASKVWAEEGRIEVEIFNS